MTGPTSTQWNSITGLTVLGRIMPVELIPWPKLPVLFESFLQDVVRDIFSEFIDTYLNTITTMGEERESLRSSAISDFVNSLENELQTLLECQKDKIPKTFCLLFDKSPSPKSLSLFAVEVQKIFGNLEGSEGQVSLKYFKAIEILGRAIQETTLVFPFRLYSLKGKLSDLAEASLRKILFRLNGIRTDYQLNGLYPINQATNLFYRKIAQAGKNVWLPIKPLVTSPLAEDEMSHYARQGDRPLELAYQIIKDSGAILVTGYRGVGKSTFINAALKNIAEIERHHLEGYSVKIVPIQMNIAKISSAGGILRLSIRAIYREFQKLEQEKKNYLTVEENKHLTFAYLRASYKVDLSQEEALSRSKSFNAAFGFKPLDFLSGPLKFYMGGFFPELQYKLAKDWNERMDQTIRLLDYDEDRAEEDIVQLVNMLSKERNIDGQDFRIKLVFIFDEMDKMDVEKGQDVLIGQLKNLLLTRHAVFLLVTSKEFYYMLLADRRKEDSILGSVFSSVVTVPMFGADETLELLKGFLDDISELSGNESKFLEYLARYLTYQSRGLPREIIRELRSYQKWIEETLQPYITDLYLPSTTLEIYSDIQLVVENLKSTTILVDLDDSTQESYATTDRIWANDGRKEQTLRGLYILMEDLLNRGSATFQRETISDKDMGLRKTLKPMSYNPYDTQNFSMITEIEFFEIFDQLARGLAKIKRPDGLADPLFQRKSLADGQGIEITVERGFYDITGRRVIRVDEGLTDSHREEASEEFLPRISQLLEQNGIQSATGEALNLLTRMPGAKVSSELSERLFYIFLNDKNISYRLEASKYITSNTLFSQLEREYPDKFLQRETDEQLLTTLIRLLTDGATTRNRQNLAQKVLTDMIQQFGGPSPSRNNPKFLNALIAAAAEITEASKDKDMASDMLVVILNILDRSSSIPDNILLSLEILANIAKRNLLLELLNADFTLQLPSGILRHLLRPMLLTDTVRLWNVAINKKNTPLRQSILIQTLPVLVAGLPSTLPILASWLNSSSWGRGDVALLKAANTAEPNLYRDLASQFSKVTEAKNPKYSTAYAKLTEIIGPSKQPKDIVKQITPADDRKSAYKNPQWLNISLGMATLVTLTFLPIETQTQINLSDLAIGQLINAVAVLAGLGTAGLALALLSTLSDPKKNANASVIAGMYIIFMIILVVLTAGSYWWLILRSFPLTILGQVIFTLCLNLIYLVPMTVERIVRFLVNRFQQQK